MLFLQPSFRHRAAVELFERAQGWLAWEGSGGRGLDFRVGSWIVMRGTHAHSVHGGQVTRLTRAEQEHERTLKAWLTAESSMDQSILPFTRTVPTKKSCCLTSCRHATDRIFRQFRLKVQAVGEGWGGLTSLKTRRSATLTTTLTRWSSLCDDPLRESVE